MISSEQLRVWDNEHVWHPFTPMSAFRDECAPIVSAAEGFFLTDTEGKTYLDGISALWCNVHGYRVPEIDQAIRDQLDSVAHSTLLGLANTPSIELARRLVEITPDGLNKVFYSDSGSTAVEVALKLVYQYHCQKPNPQPERNLFVCLSDAYHGDTLGSVSVGQMPLFHGVYRPLLFETLQLPSPVALRYPPGHTRESYLAWCLQEVEDLLTSHHERIAGVVLEPLVQGAAGILVHPRGYLKLVREITAQLEIPLIADEVAVGFGRTGTMFACEQEDVTPDVLCVAKGLSGGYLPLAATLTTDKIFAAFLGPPAAGRTFYHGHTFTGNPLGCAAALASLELLQQRNVVAHAREISARMAERLEPLSRHAHVAEVRQKGVMVGIELVADRATLAPFAPEIRLGHRVIQAARQQGVILRPLGDVIVLMPAPAMPLDLIDRLCDTVIHAIDVAISTVTA